MIFPSADNGGCTTPYGGGFCRREPLPISTQPPAPPTTTTPSPTTNERHNTIKTHHRAINKLCCHRARVCCYPRCPTAEGLACLRSTQNYRYSQQNTRPSRIWAQFQGCNQERGTNRGERIKQTGRVPRVDNQGCGNRDLAEMDR